MSYPLVHLLTPGDHYSPRTGSAVSTVVHGLSQATPASQLRPSVLVAAGTYADRYDSATPIEYRQASQHRFDRYLDAGLSRVGLPRIAARRGYCAALTSQRSWPQSFLLAHNAVQAVPLIEPRHRAALYAHNLLFRNYSLRQTRRALHGAAAIICVSQSLASQTDPYLPRELKDRVRVIRNGVDSVGFARPSSSGLADGVLRVMFIGRMIPSKGADILVEALARLGREDIHLSLIGGSGFDADDPLTPFEKEIRRSAARLTRDVDVRPFVPRGVVATLLAQADVVVVPSRWQDPCPLTVLEGMAAGAAVVGADIGGIPEQIGDAGICVPPENPVALAEVLEGFVSDRAMLASVQQRCRRHAVANDWSVVQQRLAGVLAELS
jgi:glycosyltransferase involved in cell wall biosynthesis